MKSKQAKPRSARCPYCGSPGITRSREYVFGEGAKGGPLIVCSRYPACDSYATIDAVSGRVGVMANAELRHKRIEAHRVFDRLWQSGRMSRTGAYYWLGDRLGLNRSQAHISQFSDYMCEVVIRECRSVLSIGRAS